MSDHGRHCRVYIWGSNHKCDCHVAEIERLEAKIEQLQKSNHDFELLNCDQKREVERLEAKVAKLKVTLSDRVVERMVMDGELDDV